MKCESKRWYRLVVVYIKFTNINKIKTQNKILVKNSALHSSLHLRKWWHIVNGHGINVDSIDLVLSD